MSLRDKYTPPNGAVPESRAIVFAANTSWNLFNFRANIIIALRDMGFRIVAFAPRDDYSASLEKLGVQLIDVNFKSAAISPVRDALLWFKYFRLLRAFRPAAFLGFTIKPNIYGSVAARLLRIPVINNVSGLGTAFMRKGLIMSIATVLYRLAFRRSAIVFFQNDEDRQLFLSARVVNPECAQLLPGSGVDLKRFQSAPLPVGKPFTFLLNARLLWDKGIQEYVDAAVLVRRHHPTVRFQILGFTGVDNRTSVPRSLLDRWTEEGLVQHLGATADVRPFIIEADCIVLPSYREGLPRALLEASAMGRPIIATDVPGVREVVEDGKTGLLCPVRSASELAAAMLTMIAMPLTERRAMGLAGRDKVEREFDITEVTGRYVEAVERCLIESPGKYPLSGPQSAG